MLRKFFIALGLVWLGASVARADFIVITVAGEQIALQGNLTDNGRTVTFTHPSIGKAITLPKVEGQVELVKAPTQQQQYSRMVGRAGQDANGVFEAGIWALKRGLIKQFDDAVEKTLKIDPEHANAKKIASIREKMNQPLPDDPKVEQELRAMVPRSTFQVAKSDHFILLHDTPERAGTGQKKNLASKRLDLLEQAYETFLLMFLSQGVDIDLPQQRMKVVLFHEFRDFRDFADQIGPTFSSPSGFYDRQRNVTVFYSQGSSPILRLLTRRQEEAKKAADDAKKNRVPNIADYNRWTAIFDMLVEFARTNEDISVVSHESTHQLAASTGLFPRHVMVPHWVQEGLAMYFEIPADSTWGGIGAVNQLRLDLYRAMELDREHSNIEFIVGDQIFEYADSIGAKPHGYCQAWALTHFLMENHIKEIVEYYRVLGDMPPDVKLNPNLLTQLFNTVFQSPQQLDQEWRTFMRTVRTDLEMIREQGRLLGGN